MSYEDAVVENDDAISAEKSDNQFVTFSVEGELFAAPMAPVQEIIRVPELARVPLAPASLLGLSNLRGRVLPIVNLRRIFGLPDIANTDSTRALVINLGTPMGFVVDRVASVIAVDEETIESVAGISSSIDTDLLTGVVKNADGEMVMILDFGRLVAGEFASAVAGSKGAGGAGVEQAMHNADEAEEEASDELQLVSFTVDGQEYAAEIASVQEIVQVPARTVLVPNMPGHVLGLMTLRERLLPLVSLRVMLGLPRMTVDETQRIVVLGLAGGQTVGVVADSVDEVLRIPHNEVERMPSLLSKSGELEEVSSVCRLDGGKRLVSVLDTARMFDNAALKSVLAQAARPESKVSDSEEQDNEDLDSIEDDEQVVVFRLGEEEFGVPIAAVHEIVRVPEKLTHVPKAPHFVEGVINLRGAVLPVIDQRRRLGLADLERNDRQRIMVYAFNNTRTGFIVDAVTEVLKIPKNAIERTPSLSGEQQRILGRIANLENQKRMIMLLDPMALLSDTEVAKISAIE
ncbi:purine-binding chemotaxis protein CheW [Neorhizobium lilium]|uniref:Chemotaxis protein CheW n=1 Tax=Neorhizobium lilium TaxID=2503024 RepID=A0A444LL57_9HYPH|nr:chemotaxis protein CheW [Neorhizobium lilium]RWX81008.1 purine-binding chemotaxis protein CheW [Neorhizobium lilium]